MERSVGVVGSANQGGDIKGNEFQALWGLPVKVEGEMLPVNVEVGGTKPEKAQDEGCRGMQISHKQLKVLPLTVVKGEGDLHIVSDVTSGGGAAFKEEEVDGHVLQGIVTTRYQPPGLQPSQNHPHDCSRPGPLPGQLPWPSPAITARQRHQLPPPAASPAITAHHHPSPPQPPPLMAPPGHHHRDHHISAGSWLSHHISTGTTRHPWPTPRPPSCIMIAHHCRQPPHATPRSRSLLTAPPPCVSVFPVRDLHATRHVLTLPRPTQPPGLTPSPSATTRHWNPGLSPGPYVLRSI
ncbi:hypothetical protein C0993_002227 [Termitomyces sp. T159_Od127]|nr:hypothetical protein C0993_002227 [Termitomyces sp. T159_Od127]